MLNHSLPLAHFSNVHLAVPFTSYRAADPGCLSSAVSLDGESSTLTARVTDSRCAVHSEFEASANYRSAMALHDICEALSRGRAFLDSMDARVPSSWRRLRMTHFPQECALYEDSQFRSWRMLGVRTLRNRDGALLQGFNLYTDNPMLATLVETLVIQGTLRMLPQAEFVALDAAHG
jgi:hypothetical protein